MAVREIREHFLGFISLSETTRASLTEAILEKLKDLNLCIDDLRGQGYDNYITVTACNLYSKK